MIQSSFSVSFFLFWLVVHKSIMNRNSQKTTTEVVFVDHLLLGLGPGLKSDLYTRWDSVGENEFFFCKQLSVGDSYWVKDEGFCFFPFSVMEPSLAYTCADLYMQPWSLWVHMCSINLIESGRLCFLCVLQPHWLLKYFKKVSWIHEGRI